MEITIRRCDMAEPHYGAPDATLREFSIDGRDYEIDLCPAHDQPFMDMIDKWAQAARPGVKQSPERPSRRNRVQRERSAAIRAWAISTGKHMETGGRLPVSVIREYDAAHPS